MTVLPRDRAPAVARHLPILGFFAGWTVVATFPLALAPFDHIDNWGDPLLNVWIMAPCAWMTRCC